jgi:ABC-type proline/glycine betaine transport system substrate-binding protein
MPKIPTFKATGSIEQLAGTTSNIQMGLNNTLASALAPVTETVVNFKIKEKLINNLLMLIIKNKQIILLVNLNYKLVIMLLQLYLQTML